MQRLLLALASALLLGGAVLAQPERAVSKDGKAAKAATPPAFTAEREAAALAFARKHHKELVPLLEVLKAMNEAGYRQAILDLFQVSERLGQFQKRDPKRHEVELAAWKAKSRVEVLSARLASNPSAAAEDDLREALGRQVDADRERLKVERDDVAARLSRLEENLKRLERDRDQTVETRFKKLAERGKKARKARADSAAAKAKAKPASETPSPKAKG